ncbi:PF20097 family protein [Tannockella kyphosi]|uniref:PF20097 family protein n=1 Tax=Tannockella kyphosi TaxID=2899121 RepID=UPI00201257EF|nr:PF20097 family protein [Tannockella kyphosi]
MKCPYCGEEMKAGYIQCRDSLIWDTKKRKIAILPSIRSDSIVLGSGSKLMSGCDELAYNCQKCKKIVIDYNK